MHSNRYEYKMVITIWPFISRKYALQLMAVDHFEFSSTSTICADMANKAKIMQLQNAMATAMTHHAKHRLK